MTSMSDSTQAQQAHWGIGHIATRSSLFSVVVFIAFFGAGAGVSAYAQEGPNATCNGCHDVSAKLEKSAHREVTCSTCHLKHEEYPHPANVPKPTCQTCHLSESTALAMSVHGEAAKAGKAAPDCATCHGGSHELVFPSSAQFRPALVETCSMCHDQQATEFKTSVHGKAVEAGSTQAAICSDCHGEHGIQRPGNGNSTVNANHIRETCGSCHGDVKLARKFGSAGTQVESFDQSFHGLALKSGSTKAANCASCHGFHNILPQSDRKSTIHPKNLSATCGKCHPGAGTRFSLGPMHEWEGRKESAAVAWVRDFYWILIPLTLGLMFLHNAGDWIRKVWSTRMKVESVSGNLPLGRPSREIRMYPLERLQHALLLVSFGMLTWSGFALIYPQQWWSSPLLALESRWPVRGWIHRTAGVVFIIVTVLHVVLLMRNRKLRHHWLELFPKLNDVFEAVANFAYNLGLRKTKPALSSHSYIEKAEYWAVVWGAIVMIGTGVLLWANSWTMSMFPKWVLDVATAVHFYEAVLAALAILIWHIYFIMLDPEVYPMDTAWLSGKSVRRRVGHAEHHEEPEATPVGSGSSSNPANPVASNSSVDGGA